VRDKELLRAYQYLEEITTHASPTIMCLDELLDEVQP